MNNFENIKSQWENRELPPPPKTGAEDIFKRVKSLKKDHFLTQVILVITLLILIWFFIYIKAYHFAPATNGLALMIFAIAARIVMEYLSRIKRSHIDLSEDTSSFKMQLKKYYQKRLWIHYVFTPFLFGLYIVGFVFLLPAFKENLSRGFYLYVIISFIPIMIALAWVIINQIKREVKILRLLIEDTIEA